jgi:hypothetical protein
LLEIVVTDVLVILYESVKGVEAELLEVIHEILNVLCCVSFEVDFSDDFCVLNGFYLLLDVAGM